MYEGFLCASLVGFTFTDEAPGAMGLTGWLSLRCLDHTVYLFAFLSRDGLSSCDLVGTNPKLVPTTSQTASDALAQPGSGSQDLAGVGIRMRESRAVCGGRAPAAWLPRSTYGCDSGTGLVLPLFVVFQQPVPRG
jgi:hypothetical protein